VSDHALGPAAEAKLEATIATVAEWIDSIKFAKAYSMPGQAYAKAQTAYAFALAENYNNTGNYRAAFAAAENAYISALCRHFNTDFNLSEARSAARSAAKPAP